MRGEEGREVLERGDGLDMSSLYHQPGQDGEKRRKERRIGEGAQLEAEVVETGACNYH